MEILRKLIFPPFCVGCGERMNIFSSDYGDGEAYCPKCRAVWERAKVLPCSGCGMASMDCSCVPDLLKDVKTVSLVKFGNTYEADRLIYTLKRKKSRRLFDFVSEQLAHRLFLYLREFNKDVSDTVIAYVPRNPSAVSANGFDHAKRLAEGVSERLNIELVPILKRKRGGKTQKKLTAEQRFNNSKRRFVTVDKFRDKLKGKTVVLVDDVITSGATAAACIEALKSTEYDEAVILSIAKSYLKKKKKTVPKRLKGGSDGLV